MPRYRAFGGVLDAPFPFPELHAASDDATTDWTLHVADALALAPAQAPVAVGRDELIPGVQATLTRTSEGLRLVFDDTGTFDVEDGGRRITWFPAAAANPELARVDILGRVLSIASHERGLLSLHGSAVAVAGSGIAFLAPKGSGKSTLALALASRGASLLTDDTLPVDPERAIAFPGVHSVRLWDDAAERFRALGSWRVGLNDKRTVDALPGGLLQNDPVPLAALYELIPRAAATLDQTGGDAPVASGDRAASAPVVERSLLPAPIATMVLMTHSKLGALLGGAESRLVFERCASLAARVPVYRLHVTRSLEAVDEVATTITSWHS